MNFNLIEILIVSFGAILGAYLRYCIVTHIAKFNTYRKHSILLINIASSFILGLSFSVFDGLPFKDEIIPFKLFFFIGFLGSFSTFSSFILDVFNSFLDKNYREALFIATLSVFGGIVFLLFGYSLGSL